jgi:hypothetical protein
LGVREDVYGWAERTNLSIFCDVIPNRVVDSVRNLLLACVWQKSRFLTAAARRFGMTSLLILPIYWAEGRALGFNAKPPTGG